MDKQLCSIIDYAIWIRTPLQPTKDVYIHIAKDVETKFKSSIYKFNDNYLKEKKQKNNWINERLIGCKNNGRVCYIETKKMQYLIDDNDK